MNVADIQKALRDAGFNPGTIDGIRGRKTIDAIKRFQTANGLEADGIVGKMTAAKLFPTTQPSAGAFAIPPSMPWLEEARRLVGITEIPGADSNKQILEWAQDLELTSYTNDDIAWCGLFVGHCIASQLPSEILPGNPLGARNWAKFGAPVTPGLGAIMVFWRGDRNGWLGHVGLYWAEDEKAYHILGGNQGNAVKVIRISKERLLAARWPNSAPQYTITRKASPTDGSLLSENEA